MKTTFAPAVTQHDTNYPGYALIYRVADEPAGRSLLQKAIAIGSPQMALTTTPSLLEAIYTAREETVIAVGHQAGEDLHDEVYLSVYEVSGIRSDFHVFARITNMRL